ncbi:hypothetical protein HDU97_001925 [Phlyctochytrium planicorne]|nr:hypothetical protein HDU97_001925 [Phlyctochytrium planicorne]
MSSTNTYYDQKPANAPSGDTDGLNTSIADLAAESKAAKRESFFKIPTVVLVSTLLIVTLGAVAGPLGWILQTNTVNTINTLGQTIMTQAMDKVVTKVQDVLDIPFALVEMTLRNQALERAMIYNSKSLRNETDTFLFLSSVYNASEWMNGVSCASYPNIFDNQPINRQLPNTTFIASYKLDGNPNNALYMDFSSAPYLAQLNYSLTTETFGQPFLPYGTAVNWAALMPTFEFFNYMIDKPKELDPWVSISFNQGVMIAGVNKFTYTSQFASHPSYSCSVGFENEKALGRLFSEIKVTDNAHVLMIDTTTGKLIANSVRNSVFKVKDFNDPYLPVEHFDLSTSNDTFANMIGKTLTNLYGGYAKVPRSASVVTNQVDIGDGQQWFLNTQYLARPSQWLVVLAVPRQDFFAETDRATKKAVTFSSIIAVVGVLIAVVSAFFLMRPLYKLAKAMELLTNLDFSALEGGILKERSFVAEVQHVQITFSKLCAAFAAGIRRNKALVGGTYTSRAGGTTIH